MTHYQEFFDRDRKRKQKEVGVDCEVNGFAGLHDWRFLGEDPAANVFEDGKWTVETRRRWYCTRCRKVEATTAASPLLGPPPVPGLGA